MVNVFTFPRADIDLQDIAVPQVADPTVLPVHVPLFIGFAEKGTPNIPTLGGGNALQKAYGSGFLNERSPFFQHPNVFLKRALQFQQVYFVRVVDPAATAASLVLLCSVTPGQLTQYQLASDGSRLLDSQGNPLPKLQSDGTTPVTEPGVTLKYTVRALAQGETLSTITTTTAQVNGQSVTTYPIMAFTTDVGSAGNLAGFRLFYNPDLSTTVVNNIGSLTYSFQPVTLNGLTNIEQAVIDNYNSQTQTFSFNSGAYDPTTAMYYSLVDQVRVDFKGTSGLPYDFYVYGTNVQTIGNAILAVSPELTGTNPYMINILSAVDLENHPYHHLALDSTVPTVINSNVVNYLQGGSDGTTTKTMLESLITNYLSGDVYPEIGDVFRYPITHFYDSGFTLQNKEAIQSFWALRDDVSITFSTQDVANPANTQAQDQSTGSALRGSILLNVESVDFGTQFCRAEIYQQCGTLSDTSVYTQIVPATLHRMLTRCQFGGGAFITGEPKGRPNSEVSIFNIDSLNWTPSKSLQMQQSWDSGLNYMQYCDPTKVFYADLKSVYPVDSSLLSSAVFVDYVAVYLKKIVRQQWTIVAGRDDPPTSLYKTIEDNITQRANYVLNGLVNISVKVSQTAVDTALGYQTTVTVTVKGNMPNRVWKVIVPITRNS